MFLRHSFTHNRDTARAAVRYYQLRPRGPDEPPRGLFGPEGALSREEVYRLLDERQAPGRRYLVHRLILSPGGEERPEDLRAMTYRTLRELEREKGRALAWAAVEHRNTAYPHVHVVVAGGGLGEDGRLAEVRLYPRDHARMKADAIDYCRAEARVRDDWDRALGAALSGQALREDDAGARTPARGRPGHGADRDDWSP